MLVIISDLHFQDTEIDPELSNIIKVDRNISPKAFHHFFSDIAELSKQNEATEVIFVLAGDIFDLNRSNKWFIENIRPYTNEQIALGSPLDMVVTNIWQGILNNNLETQQIFISVANLANTDNVLQTNYGKIEFRKNIDIKFDYIPGNHDRLVNLSKTLQANICGLLNMNLPQGSTFRHKLIMDKYGVFIRHGHEYDGQNFAQKLNPEDLQHENKINEDSYKEPTIGDGATIDLASAIAYNFGNAYKNEIINGANIPNTRSTYRELYQKLLEFDDVRPMSELINWIEYGIDGDAKEAWKAIDKVFMSIIEHWRDDPFLKNKISLIKLTYSKVMTYLRIWDSKDIIRNLVGGVEKDKSSEFAYYESMTFSKINIANICYIVYGHTHDPKVEFIRAEGDVEMFSFDTGTWRKRIKKCKDKRSFCWAKMLTYVVFYNKDEDKERKKVMPYSFDVWNGLTKKM